MEIEINTKYHN